MAYIIMNITIKSTKIYEKVISKLLSFKERKEMEDEIAQDPERWPIIRGSGGVRKARFSRPGMGKRGGGEGSVIFILSYMRRFTCLKRTQKVNKMAYQKKR